MNEQINKSTNSLRKSSKTLTEYPYNRYIGIDPQVLGGLAGGWLSDKKGRRLVLAVQALLMMPVPLRDHFDPNET